MAKTLVGALALTSLPCAVSFRNTSPFFLLSTTDLNLNKNDVSIAQSSAVSSQVTDALKGCPSKTYFVVQQEGVSSADFNANPNTLKYNDSDEVKSAMQIPEVVGNVDTAAIIEYLQEKCGAKLGQLKDTPAEQASEDAQPYIYKLDILASKKDSSFALSSSNSLIQSAVSNFASHGGYTIVYTTTPSMEPQTREMEHVYEMEQPFEHAVQMELKRDLSSHRRADGDANKEGGLFERYQYLSPGLFMGFTAAIPLVLILIVALKAITSLEVSYFAFSKEMGPAAQKKQ